jgi:hypothetical protein
MTEPYRKRTRDKQRNPRLRLIANAIEEKLRGEIAYERTKRMVIDMPTARAAVDAALNKEKNT